MAPGRRASVGLQAARVALIAVFLAVGVLCAVQGNVVGAVISVLGVGGAGYALVQGKALRPQDREGTDG